MTNDEDSRKEIIGLGGVGMMCDLLTSKSSQVIKNACGALLNLANEQEAWEEIRESGGVESLLKIIENEKDTVREYALGVFVNLANDEETREIIKKNRGAKILSRCLGQSNDELTRCAIGAFGTLVMDHEICEQLRELGGYPLIVEGLSSLDEDILGRTSGCLWNMAVDGPESRDELIKVGAHEHACKMIKKTQDPEVYGNLAMFLSILAENEEVSETIRESGAIKYIVKGLGHDQDQVRGNCIAAIWNLGHVRENREPMKELGLVPGLIDLFDTKDEETMWKTLGALITVGPHEGIATEFKESEGIQRLIPLIEDESQERICLYAVIALAVLAYQDCNKDEIREAGGIGPLITLLGSKNENMIEKVLSAMLNLSLNAENRTAFRQLDGIAPLIELLYHTNPNIQQNAAGVLWNLSNDEKNKKLIRELGGLNALLTLIGGGTIEPMRKKIPRAKDRVDEVDDDEIGSKIREAIDGEDIEIGFRVGDDTDENPRDGLENYCGKIRKRLKNDSAFQDCLSVKEKRILEESTQDGLDWLHDNPMADDDEILSKRKEVEKKCQPIVIRVDAFIELEANARALKKRINEDEDFMSKLTPDEKKRIQDLTDELMNWLEENPNATKEEIDAKRKEFDAKVAEILGRSNALADLELYGKETRKRLDDSDKLSAKEKRIIDEATQDLADWIRDHPFASKEEIDRKRKEFHDTVDPIIQRVNAMEDLEKYGKSLKGRRDDNDFLTNREKRIIDDAMDELAEWMRDHPDATKEQIEKKKKEIMDRIEPILARAEAMKDLSEYGKELRKRADNERFLTSKEKRIIDDAMEELNEWLRDHPDATKEEIEKKKKEIMDRLEPLFARAAALSDLDDYNKNLRKRREKLDAILTTKEKKILDDIITDLSEWIQDNPDSKKDEIEKKKKQVQDKAEPILNRAEAVHDLETYMEDAKKRKDKFGDVLTSKDKRAIDNRLEDVLDWLKDHPDAKKEDIEKQKKLLSEKIEPIFDKAGAIVVLQKNCESIRTRRDLLSIYLTTREKKTIENEIEDALDWIKDHPDATVSDIEKREKELLDKVEPIFARAEAMESLDLYGKGLDKRMQERSEVLTQKEKKTIENAALDIEDWVKDNSDAKKDEIIKKKNQIKDKIEPIFDRADAMMSLIKTTKDLNHRKEELSDHLTEKEKKKIAELIDEANQWIKDHPDATRGEIDKKGRDLRSKIDPILQRGEAVEEFKSFTESSAKKKLDLGDCLNDREKKKVDRLIDEANDWMKSHPDAKTQEIEKHRRDLRDALDPIFKRGEAVRDFRDFVDDVEEKKIRLGDNLSKKEKKSLDDAIEDARDWLKANPDAKIEDLERKKRQFRDKTDPIIEHGDSVEKIKRSIENMKQRTNELGDNLTAKEKKQVEDILGDLNDWLNDHPDAKTEEAEKKHREAKEKVEKILSRGETMSDLKDALKHVRAKKDDLDDTLTPKEKKLLDDSIRDLDEWIKKNPEARKEDIEKRMRAFHDKVDPIIERAQAMKDLGKFTNQTSVKPEIYGDSISAKEKKKVSNEVDDARDWIKDHGDAKKEEIGKERKLVKEHVDPIFAHADAVLSSKNAIKDVRERREHLGSVLNAKDRQKLEDLANDFEDWLRDHPDAKIEEIEKERKRFLAAVDPILKKGEAILDAKNFIKEVNKRMDDAGSFISDKERQKVQEVLSELDEWSKTNPNATADQIEKKKREIKDRVEKMIERGESMYMLSKLGDDNSTRKNLVNDFLTEKEKIAFEKATSDLKDWIRTHPDAKVDEIKKQRTLYSDIVDPILERAESLANLDKLSQDISSSKDFYGDALTEKEKRAVDKAVSDTQDWISTHPDATKSDVERQRKTLTSQVDPIFSRANAVVSLQKTIDDGIKGKDELKDILNDREKRILANSVRDAEDWIKDYPNATQKEISDRNEELKKSIDPILERGNAMLQLLKRVDEINDKKTEYSEFLSEKEKKVLDEAAKELVEWKKNNPNAPKEQIIEKLNEVNDRITPIMARVESMAELKRANANAKIAMDKFDEHLSTKEKKNLGTAIADLNVWIQDHPDAKKDEIDRKKREFKELVDPIISRAEAVHDLCETSKKVKETKDDLGDHLSEKDKRTIDSLIADVADFIKSNPEAPKDDVERKKKDFVSKSDPILKKGIVSQTFTFHIEEAKRRRDLAKEFLTREEQDQIDILTREMFEWIKANPNATREEIERKQFEFLDKVNKILGRAEKMLELQSKSNDSENRKVVLGDILNNKEKRTVHDGCEEALDWIKANPKAKKEDVEKQLKILSSAVDPILDRAEAIRDIHNLSSEIRKAQIYLGSALTEKEKKDIDRAVKDAEDWIVAHPDAKKKEIEKQKTQLQKTVDPLFARATAEKNLGDLADTYDSRLKDPSDSLSNLSETERKKIQREVDSVKDWMESHPHASLKELEKRTKEFNDAINPLVERAETKKKLEESAIHYRDQSNDPEIAKRLDEKEKRIITRAIEEALDFLHEHPLAPTSDLTKETTKLDSKAKPIIERAEAKKSLDEAIANANLCLNDPTIVERLSEKEKEVLKREIVEAKEWVKSNPNVSTEDIVKRRKNFDIVVNPIIERAQVKKRLEETAIDVKQQVDDQNGIGIHIQEKEKKIVKREADSALDWMKDNGSAPTIEISAKLKHLEAITTPIIERVTAIKTLSDKADKVKKRLNDDNDPLSKASSKDKRIIEREADDVLQWLAENPNASKDEILARMKKFDDKVTPIVLRREALHSLNTLTTTVRYRINDPHDLGERIAEKDKKMITESIRNVQDWLDENPDATPDQINKKKRDLEDKINPIIERAEAEKNLDDYTKYIKKRLANELDSLHNLDSDDLRKVKDAVDRSSEWLDKNPNSTREKLVEKMNELDVKVRPIVERADAREQFEESIKDIKETMKNPNVVSRIKKDDVKLIEKELKEATNWNKDNSKAPAHEIINQKSEFEKKLRPIIERAEAQDILETYARDLKSRLQDDNDIGGSISDKDRRVVNNAADDALNFLNDNPNSTKKEALDKKRELEVKVNPIIAKEEAKRQLENLIYNIQDRLKNDDKLKSRLTPEEKRKYDKLTKEVSEWLQKNPNANHLEILDKKKELEDIVQSAFDRADAMNALADEVDNVRQKLDKEMKGLTSEEKKNVEKAVRDTERWIDSNADAEKKKIDQKREVFVNSVVPIVKRAEARAELSEYANDVRDRIAKDKKLESRIPTNERKIIDTETKNALDWLKKNENDATSDQIMQKKIQLEDMIQPIMNRAEATKDLVYSVSTLEKELAGNDSLSIEERNNIKDEISKLKTWLERNPDATRKEADEKQRALDDFVNPIIQRAQVRKELKDYTTGLKHRMAEDQNMTKNLAPEEKKLVEKKTDDVLTYLEKNKEPKVSEMMKLSEDLKENVEPLFENAKARGNLESYANDLKNRTKDIQKDLSKDQLSNLEGAIDHALHFLKKNPTANQTDVLVEKKKLETIATPMFETAKTNMADRVKLENLAKNIQSQLESAKQLKDLDSTKKNAIRNIALEAEEWLRANPNATEAEIREYMKGLYNRLGDHTNFKFSVWVVANYGLGYGFSEALKWGKAPDPKKDDNKYVSSFLGINKKPKETVATSFGKSGSTETAKPSYVTSDPKESAPIVVHASANKQEDWGKELKVGAVSDIKSRFQKQISKEEQELDKKFAELKKNTGNKTADLSKLSVQK